MKLISSFPVILSNVIRLVCQDFINPECFLHKVLQPAGVLNGFFERGASLRKGAGMAGQWTEGFSSPPLLTASLELAALASFQLSLQSLELVQLDRHRDVTCL